MKLPIFALALGSLARQCRSTDVLELVAPPSLTACQPAWIEWDGGVAPFTLTVLQQVAGGLSVFTRDEFSDLSEHGMTYFVTASANDSLAFSLRDAHADSQTGPFRGVFPDNTGNTACTPPVPIDPVEANDTLELPLVPPEPPEEIWTWDQLLDGPRIRSSASESDNGTGLAMLVLILLLSHILL